jgi:hypothetical protein
MSVTAKKESVKRKNAPTSEDTASGGRIVHSHTSATSVKTKSSSLRLVPIVLVNAHPSGSTSAVSSSSCQSLNTSAQPPATASSLLSDLDHIQTKLGKDMMVALVEIARVRVQVEALHKVGDGGSIPVGTDGDDVPDDSD